jgi:hypothetical protein
MKAAGRILQRPVSVEKIQPDTAFTRVLWRTRASGLPTAAIESADQGDDGRPTPILSGP